MSYLDARSWLELPAEERRRTIDWLREWDHKPKLLADFLQSLEERLGRGERLGVENRESGGSIPTMPLRDIAKMAGFKPWVEGEPPDLNKSGGSKVPCGGDYYRPGSPHAKEGCTADDCKILGPLVNKSGGSDVEGK